MQIIKMEVRKTETRKNFIGRCVIGDNWVMDLAPTIDELKETMKASILKTEGIAIDDFEIERLYRPSFTV